MRKYFFVLTGLLLILLFAGCGGSSSTSHTVISGVEPDKFTSTTDIVPSTSTSATYYLVDINGTRTFQFNSDTTRFSSSFVPRTSSSGTAYTDSGTWAVSSDGKLVLTKTTTTGSTTETFSRIQSETSTTDTSKNYWLVFNETSEQNSRMYSVDPSTLSLPFDPTIMGGAIQGTALSIPVPTTSVIVVYGSTDGVSDKTDGIGTAARFHLPTGITYVKGSTTDTSYFFVADTDNHLIRKIDSSGKVTTFAGTGSSGSTDSTTGTLASFNKPQDITNDGTYLYVADTGNHAIRQIAISSGAVTTIAGTAGSAGSIDSATGTSAYFNTPSGITTDGTNLYVADQRNCTIRKIKLWETKDGVLTHAVSTLAGSTGSSNVTNGTYTSARFLLPVRLTTDGTYLYVVDYSRYGDSLIRRVTIATGVVTIFTGSKGSFTFGHLGGITTDGTYLYMGYNDNDAVNTSIRRVTIAAPTAPPAELADITIQYTAVGYAPPYGLTTDGASLFFTSSKKHNITKVN